MPGIIIKLLKILNLHDLKEFGYLGIPAQLILHLDPQRVCRVGFAMDEEGLFGRIL